MNKLQRFHSSMRLVMCLLAFSSFALFATEDQTAFADPVKKELYGDLIKELRCPKCQNQNIADSNAVVAKDMRAKTKELVEQGQNKQQVIDYMVARYGQFAHYQPPLNIATSLLWLLPVLFITFGIVMLLKRSKNSALNAELADSSSTNVDDELDKALQALLAKSEPPQVEKEKGENQ